MRLLLVLVAFAIVFSLLLLGLAQLASAGSTDAPELSDPEGDCAVPYGNAYLDVIGAWIGAETVDTFDVHLQLSSWEAEVAEGSGYTVQFSHQGTSWGVVAVYSAILAEGWGFSTGVATADLAEGLEEAPGSFDEAARTITITFAKSLFPHVDMNETTVRDFVAMSADLRPAIPFFLGEPAGLDGNGRWIVCDEAVGTGTYTLGMSHGGEHAMHGATVEEDAAVSDVAAAEVDPGTSASPSPTPAEVPVGTLAILALAVGVALALRRR